MDVIEPKIQHYKVVKYNADLIKQHVSHRIQDWGCIHYEWIISLSTSKCQASFAMYTFVS